MQEYLLAQQKKNKNNSFIYYPQSYNILYSEFYKNRTILILDNSPMHLRIDFMNFQTIQKITLFQENPTLIKIFPYNQQKDNIFFQRKDLEYVNLLKDKKIQQFVIKNPKKHRIPLTQLIKGTYNRIYICIYQEKNIYYKVNTSQKN